MRMMKARHIRPYGTKAVSDPKQNAPTPASGKWQVFVSVRAAVVNPIDGKVLAGYLEAHAALTIPVTVCGDVFGEVPLNKPPVQSTVTPRSPAHLELSGASRLSQEPSTASLPASRGGQATGSGVGERLASRDARAYTHMRVRRLWV
jgi:hypothetical protein